MSILRSYKMPHELSADEAFQWFQDHDFYEIPPYFLTHWKTNKRFFFAYDSLLAFEETPKNLIIAGEPLSIYRKEDIERDIHEAFLRFAQTKTKRVCGYYVGRGWKSTGFSKVPLGTSIRIPLDDFDISSPRASEARRALRKGQQNNYRAVPLKDKDPWDQVKVYLLHKKWMASKPPFQIKFLLSKPQADHAMADFEEWFAVEKNGEFLAFCSILPFLKGGEIGFYVDNLIYDPKKDPHALSFLLAFLMESLKQEGVSEINLGLSPFARLSNRLFMERFFTFLYQLPYFYSAKGLHYFKRKFGGYEQREYCFFQNKNSKWLQMAEMARATLQPGH